MWLKIADQEPALAGVGAPDNPDTGGAQSHSAFGIGFKPAFDARDLLGSHLLERLAPIRLDLLGGVGCPQQRVVEKSRPAAAVRIHP